MKPLCLSILVISFALTGSCQGIINGGFELWENNKKPVGWMISTGSGVQLTTDAHSGLYAAEIFTWYVKNLGGVASGSLVEAAADPYSNFTVGGLALPQPPAQLIFYYKFKDDAAPGQANVFINVLLKKKSMAGKIDTVQFITQKLMPSEKYKLIEIPFHYSPNIVPDSILIGFYSHGFCVDNSNAPPSEIGNCLHLKIDDVSLQYKETGNHQIETNPNPFNANLQIQFVINSFSKVNIRIFNSLGQIVAYPVKAEFYTAGTYVTNWKPHLSRGVYYCVFQTNNSKQIIKKLLYLP